MLSQLDVSATRKEEMDRFLPSILTTAGLLAFIQKWRHTTYGERISHQMVIMAMNHLLYLDYEAILVACVRHGMHQVFELLIDNGIDYRLCANQVLMEIGDKPDDSKVGMFLKFVQEKQSLLHREASQYEGSIPSTGSKFIAYIHGARALGYEQGHLREFWHGNDHTALLSQAIAQRNMRAVEYFIHSSLCISGRNEERMMSFAIQSLSLPIIEPLLQRGLSPRVIVVAGDEADGTEALVYVAGRADQEIVQAVARRLPYDDNEDVYDSAIEEACRKKNTKVEKLLLRIKEEASRDPEDDFEWES